MDEIKLLVEKYSVEGINIVDDLFLANKKRLSEFADELEKEGISVEIIDLRTVRPMDRKVV